MQTLLKAGIIGMEIEACEDFRFVRPRVSRMPDLSKEIVQIAFHQRYLIPDIEQLGPCA